jgi:hypothetical protein
MSSFDFNSPVFLQAFKDYYYLKNRNYPDKLTLKAVGDRYKLSGTTRTLLYRGVFGSTENALHYNRLYKDCRNCELHIDTYNILFTLINYKLGRLVFIGTDDFCRDTGSLFGKIKKQEYFNESAIQLVEFVSALNPPFVVFYLDSPVSFSKDHKYFLEKLIDSQKLIAEARLAHSADNELINTTCGIICTSDSAIINQAQRPVADLSRQIIQYFYKPDFINLKVILESNFLS